MAGDFSATFQAEDAVAVGPTFATNHNGFDGTGFVDYQNASSDLVRWDVLAPADGDYAVTLRYALGAAGDRPLRLSVNDEAVEAAWSMPSTGGWDSWATVETTARLRAGSNILEASAIGSSGANIDWLRIESTDRFAAVVYEAESAKVTGGRIDQDHAGYTGDGFVNYLHGTGDVVDWTVQADRTGAHELTFRYSLSDSSEPFSHVDRPLSIEVNGVVVDAALSFPYTGGSWTNWGEVKVVADLHAGENHIRAVATGDSGANVDHLRVRDVGVGRLDNPGGTSNQPPQLAPIEDQPGTSTLHLTARTADHPAGVLEAVFTATATDDGPVALLRYRLKDAPDGATIDASTGRFAWTLPLDDDGYPRIGTYSLTVVVTDQDGYGLSDEQYVYIEVSRPYAGDPSANLTAPTAQYDRYVLTGKSTYAFAADKGIFANDSKSTPDYFEVVGAPSWLTIDASDGSFVAAPPADVPSETTFQYRIGIADAVSGVLWSNFAVVAVAAPKVAAVTFTRSGSMGTLTTMDGGSLATASEVVFFPDAPDLTWYDKGRNVVRVRIELNVNQAGVPIYIRSYDVDDPSSNDPNSKTDRNDAGDGPNDVRGGGDNRGLLNDAGTAPIDSFDTMAAGVPWGVGYVGRLRKTGEPTFQGEWAIIELRSQASADPKGKAFVEVDLATSFAPGDNFRVAASTSKDALTALKMEAPSPTSLGTWDVPSRGPIPNFDGAASPLLTIWRRLHIEQDHMAKTEGDKANRVVAAGPGAAVDGVLVIATAPPPLVPNPVPMVKNEYEGGILRIGDKNFEVVGNDAAGNISVKVRAGVVVPAAGALVTVYQDDWKSTGDGLPVTKINPTDTSAMYLYLKESFNRNENRYADAFIMPQLSTLDRFDSEVPAATHLSTNDLLGLLDLYRGSKFYETDFFWTTYVTSAFEGPENRDGDGDGDSLLRGISDGPHQQVAVVFLNAILQPESNLDDAAWRPGVTTAHEIGHTLGLAYNTPDGHREPGADSPNESNLMSSGDNISSKDFTFLDPIDMAFLRLRRSSPGR